MLLQGSHQTDHTSTTTTLPRKYAAATKTKVGGNDHIQNNQNFDVYMLSSKKNKEIIFDDANLTKVINDAVEVYKECHVEDAKVIDTERLKTNYKSKSQQTVCCCREGHNN